MSALFAIILTLLAIFLILLVLVQRGRGGGLAGALGGMGGSSAFGAKAGDVFTRITIVTAAIWIGISIIAFFWAKHGGDPLSRADDAFGRSAPADPNAGRAAATTAPTAGKSDAESSTLPRSATQALEAEEAAETPPPAATKTAPPEVEPAPPADAESK